MKIRFNFYSSQWCLHHHQNWHRPPCSCQHQGDQQPLESRCSFSQSSFPELGFVNRRWQNPWIGTCYYRKVTKSPNWIEMLIETRPGKQCKSLIDVMIFTGWFLVVLGQYRVVLVDIWCYWVSTEQCWLVLVVLGQYNLVYSVTGLVMGFYACIYWKKLMVTPTDRPTNRQGEYRAICLFEI